MVDKVKEVVRKFSRYSNVNSVRNDYDEEENKIDDIDENLIYNKISDLNGEYWSKRSPLLLDSLESIH